MNDEDKVAVETEIEILKQIDHPNIVKLHEVYEDDDYWCLVIELMQGGDLLEYLLENKCFKEVEVRNATYLLIDAIRYCHQIGIMHRDLKPENLLIKKKDIGLQSLKIGDFGLAKIIGEKSMSNTICGSSNYVAPEIIMMQPYDNKCDIWSLGVVIFAMLSGQLPFYEKDQNKIFDLIKNCKFSFEDEAWSNISNEAKDFIKRILVADPI